MAAFATAASSIYFFMFSLSLSLPLGTGAAVAAVDAALMQIMSNLASRASRRVGEALDSTCVHVSRAHEPWTGPTVALVEARSGKEKSHHQQRPTQRPLPFRFIPSGPVRPPPPPPPLLPPVLPRTTRAHVHTSTYIVLFSDPRRTPGNPPPEPRRPTATPREARLRQGTPRHAQRVRTATLDNFAADGGTF